MFAAGNTNFKFSIIYFSLYYCDKFEKNGFDSKFYYFIFFIIIYVISIFLFYAYKDKMLLCWGIGIIIDLLRFLGYLSENIFFNNTKIVLNISSIL